MKVFVVLGATAGEWQSWVEGVFTHKEDAQKLAADMEEEDSEWGNAYYVEESVLRTKEAGNLLRGDSDKIFGYPAEGA